VRFRTHHLQSVLALAAALAMLAFAAQAMAARPPAGRARDISSDPGFDWGAAAIGAGAAIALLLLGSMAAIAFPIKTRR